jgi:hypothetical protein
MDAQIHFRFFVIAGHDELRGKASISLAAFRGFQLATSGAD